MNTDYTSTESGVTFWTDSFRRRRMCTLECLSALVYELRTIAPARFQLTGYLHLKQTCNLTLEERHEKPLAL